MTLPTFTLLCLKFEMWLRPKVSSPTLKKKKWPLNKLSNKINNNSMHSKIAILHNSNTKDSRVLQETTKVKLQQQQWFIILTKIINFDYLTRIIWIIKWVDNFTKIIVHFSVNLNFVYMILLKILGNNNGVYKHI